MDEHHVTFIVMDGIQVLDLFGPLEAFAAARELSGSPYLWQIASSTDQPVRTESGSRILPDVKFEQLEKTDTVVFVGGQGPRTTSFSSTEHLHISRLAKSARRIATVCTGTFAMARLGLASNKTVTTHWRYTDELEKQFPELNIDKQALFVKDGSLWSSAGITAGIDMALAIIAEDCGSAVSTSVARQLVMYLKRPGNQAQFSEFLIAQSGSTSRFSDVLTWVADNLHEQIDVAKLAELANMSSRHFSRLFKKTTGSTPAQYVEQMRLDRARILLGEVNGRVHQIALSVGFTNPDSFCRAFERRFSTTPKKYRAQFCNSREVL